MANNHEIRYLAIDLTGLLYREKPHLRVPETAQYWPPVQINFVPGKPVDVEPPRAVFVMAEGVRPTADMFTGHFGRSPNPRPFYVQYEGRHHLVDSHRAWVELCNNLNPRGDEQ
jgi:hypothetical protein